MDDKLTSSSSHQMTAGFRKNKMAEPDEQWVYSGGETPIRKLPDMLLAKIMAELDHPEHVRTERVSKWFQHVGLDLSWHDVTLLTNTGMPPLKEHLAAKALFLRCKRLSELSLSANIGFISININMLSCLKHICIRSESTDLANTLADMKLFTKIFPLQGLLSLCIRFRNCHDAWELFEMVQALFEAQHASSNDINALQLLNLESAKRCSPIGRLPPNIRFLRLIDRHQCGEHEPPFPIAENVQPVGIRDNVRALAMALPEWHSEVTRFRNLIYLDLELFNNRYGEFLRALIETDVFSNLRALKFSCSYISKNPLPYENLLIGCPMLEHLQLCGVYMTPENVESISRLLDLSASRLISFGLNAKFVNDSIPNTIRQMLASAPASLKAISVLNNGWTALPDHEREGVHFYRSVDKLWNVYGLPVAKSVLDQPPSSRIFYL